MFQPGCKKPEGSGKKKGTKNKKTLAFEEALAKHNFNPVDAMVWIYNESKEQYQMYKENVASGRWSPMEDQSAKYMGICAQMAKEMGSYLYSKPKSIELKSADGEKGIKITVADYLTEHKK